MVADDGQYKVSARYDPNPKKDDPNPKKGRQRSPAVARPRSAMAVLLGLGSPYLGSYRELSYYHLYVKT